MTPAKFDYTLLFAANTGWSNPGPGQGNYVLKSEVTGRTVGKMGVELCDKSDKMTNIAADYTCLLIALEKLISLIKQGGGNANNSTLQVIGYSQVVIKQLGGEFGVGSNVALYDAVKERLDTFVSWQAVWMKKAELVKEMGA